MDHSVEGSKAVRFSTTYNPPVSGNHYLSYSSLGPSKLFINGTLHQEQPNPTKDSMSFLLGVQDEIKFQYHFEKGKSYAIRIDTYAPAESNGELFLVDGHISVHLGLVQQEEM